MHFDYCLLARTTARTLVAVSRKYVMTTTTTTTPSSRERRKASAYSAHPLRPISRYNVRFDHVSAGPFVRAQTQVSNQWWPLKGIVCQFCVGHDHKWEATGVSFQSTAGWKRLDFGCCSSRTLRTPSVPPSSRLLIDSSSWSKRVVLWNFRRYGEPNSSTRFPGQNRSHTAIWSINGNLMNFSKCEEMKER